MKRPYPCSLHSSLLGTSVDVRNKFRVAKKKTTISTEVSGREGVLRRNEHIELGSAFVFYSNSGSDCLFPHWLWSGFIQLKRTGSWEMKEEGERGHWSNKKRVIAVGHQIPRMEWWAFV